MKYVRTLLFVFLCGFDAPPVSIANLASKAFSFSIFRKALRKRVNDAFFGIRFPITLLKASIELFVRCFESKTEIDSGDSYI